MLNKYKITEFIPDNISLDTNLPITCGVNKNLIFPRFRDNRELCLPTGNQKETSYCTGFSVAGYIEVKYWNITHKPKQFDSKLIYEGAKKLDSIDSSGSYIEYAMKSAINLGYNKLINKSDNIIRILNSESSIKKAICEDDVFVGAFLITSDWNYVSRKGYIVDTSNNNFIGGHAVLVCGYDEKGIWIQNSWGHQGWGLYGFGHLSWSQVKLQFKYGIRLY